MKAETIEHVFGRGRLRMATGEHVEVYREAVVGHERRRYTKRFLATGDADFRQWTEREWRILARLIGHGVRCVPDVVQFEGGVSGGLRQVQTYDAGVTVDQWATLLPVMRDGVVRRHVFEDCAHWWALAHHCLAALDEIHALALVHLDVKADNICIPYGPAAFDPAAGAPLHALFDRLALIDFAFSLVSREKLATALPIGWQKDYDYQSPRLLRALEAGRDGDLRPTQELDWRCDLYSLAAMLRRYLPGDGCMRDGTAASGWSTQRYDDARALVFRLRECHDRDLASTRPHADLMEISGAYLAAPDLVDSLRDGWRLASEVEVTSGASLVTPLTRIAVARTLVTPPTAVRAAPLATRIPVAIMPATPLVFTPVPAVMRRPRVRAVPAPATAPTPVVGAVRAHRGMMTAMVASLVAAMAVATPSFLGEPARVDSSVVAKSEAPAPSATTGSPASAAPASAPTTGSTSPASAPTSSAPASTSSASAATSSASTPATPASAPTSVPPPATAAAGTAPLAAALPATSATRGAASHGMPSASATKGARERVATRAASSSSAGKASRMSPAAASRTPPLATAHATTMQQVPAAEKSMAASTPAEATHAAAPIVSVAPAEPPNGAVIASSSEPPLAAAPAAPARNAAAPRSAPTAPSKPVERWRAALHDVLKLFGAVEQRPAVVEERSVSTPHPARAAQRPAVVASLDARPPVLAHAQPAAGSPAATSPQMPAPQAAVAQPAAPQATVTAAPQATVTQPAAPQAAAPQIASPQIAAPLPTPPAIATVDAPSPTTSASDDLGAKGRRMIAETLPRIAAQANADAYPILWSASIANSPAQNRAVLEAAYAPWRSERAYPLVGDDASRARALYNEARQAFAAGRDDEALDRALRGFAANPRDPDLAGFLAFLHLQIRPLQPETARQLALHALAFSGSRRSLRLDDWNTLAVASALAGREVDASRAFYVMLALTDDVETTCRSAVRAYATFGPRLRGPVEALLQRAHAQGRDYDAPACAGPANRTLARGL